jgi:D-glycero-D-manno-heptose 1,7-bisphosphate phosphatase
MKRAAVFFDRDNTLIANDGYLGDPNGVVLVDGAADAIARARALGFAIVVFSNQSGVARGMFGEEAVHAVNHRLDEMLLDDNGHAVIDRHEFCPFHPEAEVERYRQDSDLRKPKPGMILQAERQLALDLSRSWVVGDAPRDIDAGKAAGCRTVLVKNGSLKPSDAANEQGEHAPDFEVETLREAMEVIARHRTESEAPVEPAPAPAPPEPEPVPPAPEPQIAEAVEPAVTTTDYPVEEKPVETSPETPAPQRAEPDRPAPIAPEPAIAAVSSAQDDEQDEDSDEPLLPRGKSRSEILLGQILDELRRRHEHPENDFSVSKLMAGVVQVVALAALFLAYLRITSKSPDLPSGSLWLLAANFLQTFTIALLIMGRQK